MKSMPIIFKSDPNAGSKGPRFHNQDLIQISLERICSAWYEYLSNFIDQTKKKELFGEPEYLWLGNERVIIGSLSAAITRGFQSSLTIEELSVPKAANPGGGGRVDLWASIPDLPEKCKRFSFYLEAKKSQQNHTLTNLGSFLASKNGFSKVIRDFRKNRNSTMDQRSTYSKLPGRKHAHFVIGMLITRLKREEHDPTGQEYVQSVKDKLLRATKIYVLADSKQITNEMHTKRKLDRFPTVALLIPPSEQIPGMLATFTVLARTRTLSNPIL